MAQMAGMVSGQQTRTKWLPHLTEEIVADARGPELGAYVIALEGWRRGLTLKWHVKDHEKFKDIKTWSVDKPGKLFSLSSKERTHYFFRTRGDKVTNEAVELGEDKNETKKMLMQSGVATPEGIKFDKATNDDTLINFAERVEYPVVIKPINDSFGREVITDIKNKYALKKVLTHLKRNFKNNEFLLEKHIKGNEYRIYVVDDQVFGAIKRLPSNVVGDGVNDIRTLILLKNKWRAQNPRLVNCLIGIDDKIEAFIGKKGYSYGSVLEKGKRLFLNGVSNISQGGDSIDVLDELPLSIKNIAVQAIKAIPGLNHGAVDIMVSKDKNGDIRVIEINPTAQIGSILYPSKGIARDIPAAIIDYYFPETIGYNRSDLIYFDLKEVLKPLYKHIGSTTQVNQCPEGRLYAKRYIVYGLVQNPNYHRKIRKRALECNLNGFINNYIKKGYIEVIVSGTDEKIVNGFRNILTEKYNRVKIKEIKIEDWKEPIKFGFNLNQTRLNLTEEWRMVNVKEKNSKKQLDKIERQYDLLLKSNSWRVTSPIRKITAIFKTK